jgi:hypothetical protein
VASSERKTPGPGPVGLTTKLSGSAHQGKPHYQDATRPGPLQREVRPRTMAARASNQPIRIILGRE